MCSFSGHTLIAYWAYCFILFFLLHLWWLLLLLGFNIQRKLFLFSLKTLLLMFTANVCKWKCSKTATNQITTSVIRGCNKGGNFPHHLLIWLLVKNHGNLLQNKRSFWYMTQLKKNPLAPQNNWKSKLIISI